VVRLQCAFKCGIFSAENSSVLVVARVFILLKRCI